MRWELEKSAQHQEAYNEILREFHPYRLSTRLPQSEIHVLMQKDDFQKENAMPILQNVFWLSFNILQLEGWSVEQSSWAAIKVQFYFVFMCEREIKRSYFSCSEKLILHFTLPLILNSIKLVLGRFCCCVSHI